jgi:hypothetical protein
MRPRILLAGLLAMPGCAWDGSISLSPTCGPCRPPVVVRSCGEPLFPAPLPPAVIHSTPQVEPTPIPGDLSPAPVEPVEARPAPEPTPTTKWRPVHESA